jgi:hypothetical protein
MLQSALMPKPAREAPGPVPVATLKASLEGIQVEHLEIAGDAVVVGTAFEPHHRGADVVAWHRVLAVVRMRGILATKFGDGRPWRAASPHRFRLVPGVAAFFAVTTLSEFGTRVPGASAEPQDGWRCLGRTLWRVHPLPRYEGVNWGAG